MADANVPNPITNVNDLNPRITAVQLEIRNSDAILQLQRKFDSFNIQVKANEAINGIDNDFFRRYNLNQRAQPDNGGDHIIDVQPDMRFPTSYLIYAAIKAFPDLDIKAHPSVSLYSLVAYEIIMLTAHLLLQDTVARPQKSFHAQQYHNDVERHDYLNHLMQCYVPDSLSTLLEALATTYDPAKPHCAFVPSLAGCIFEHDYGRLLPPHIFLTMHNLLATQRSSVPIIEMKRLFYREPVIQVGQNIYTVSNFIAGYFAHQGADGLHNNWINRIIEDFFSPSCGRAHIARPNLVEIPFQVEEVAQDLLNPYDLMLVYSDTYFAQISQFVRRVSSFFEISPNIKAVPLARIAEKIGGITVLSHTVENFELPTWHKLTQVSANPFDTKSKLKNFNIADYAKVINFKQKPTQHKGKLKIDPEKPEVPVYVDPAAKLDEEQMPYKFKALPTNPNPDDVLIFQPYQRNLNIATTATTLGIKIVNEEFDASVVPLPNVRNPLNFINSCYLNGSVPSLYVRPITPNGVQHIQPVERVIHPAHPNGFAIRDATRVVDPIFVPENLNLEANGELLLRGVQLEENHNDPNYAYTYTAWRDDRALEINGNTLYLWSSYRNCTPTNTQHTVISMYYSMIPIYGLGVPMYRIPHPSTMQP